MSIQAVTLERIAKKLQIYCFCQTKKYTARSIEYARLIQTFALLTGERLLKIERSNVERTIDASTAFNKVLRYNQR